MPAARHYSLGQWARAPLGWEGLPQSSFRARCRGLVLEAVSIAAHMTDHGGDCIVEIGNRNRCMEDSDDDIMQVMFSFGSHPVWGGL